MSVMKWWLQGMGIGAGLMYFGDPQSGRRRRALVLDQVDHAKHCTEDYLDKARRDLRNRASGTRSEVRSLLQRDGADDRVIAARVRSAIGRYCSHPHAIQVESHDGHVTLGGPILRGEVDDLIRAVRWVRGVEGVENRLEAHDERRNLSALQGGAPPPGEHYDFLQQSWSPATRLIGQVAGAALMGNCALQRDLTSKLLGAAGLGLFLRASMNRSLSQIVGLQTYPPMARFHRTVTLGAPAEKVWQFMTDFEEVARYLPHVESVQALGEDRYRWGLRLPGDQVLQLEERVTDRVPNQRLSWESVAGQAISYCGTVSLQPEGENNTRVNVDFQYTPPGGALATALASAFGVDPASQFHEAVMRIKSFLETGNRPHDLHEVNRDVSREEPAASRE